MSAALKIDRLTLHLQGVRPDLARAALDGLDIELLHRLDTRAIDPARWRALAPTLRLPPVDARGATDPALLRGLIADGLAALLAPAQPGEETEAP
ncbi:hypothetical protein AB8810_23820 [Xanthomonas sp. NCPPB 3005]|jgi:hypothetical protein|uniref:hypothetical protein n=1 Tax=Xanthomonas sp. NCPPB 3005 TaxID=3240913 RepID=UPI00355AC9DC